MIEHRTDVVGSLLRPDWLKQARAEYEAGALSDQAFKRIEDRAVDEAVALLDRLAISPQCGFASTMERNRLTEADQEAKLRLAVEVAQEVWGA